MSDTRRKFQRRKIKEHEEFLNNPKYLQKVEKPIKVKKREQQEKEAEKAIREASTDLSD
jgi:hypothetical protein